MQIKMLSLSKERYFFNKFHLILFCLFVSKMKKVVTKYDVCYSNSALRLYFRKKNIFFAIIKVF